MSLTQASTKLYLPCMRLKNNDLVQGIIQTHYVQTTAATAMLETRNSHFAKYPPLTSFFTPLTGFQLPILP